MNPVCAAIYALLAAIYLGGWYRDHSNWSLISGSLWALGCVMWLVAWWFTRAAA